MLEDHEERIKIINDFKIQQKQNYWEKMLDNDQPAVNKQRPLMKSQEVQRGGGLPKPLSRPMTNDVGTKSEMLLRR
jgi:hypothetical protein